VKKGNQWHFGMKCHTGVDAGSGVVHTVEATAANVHDVTVAARLLLRFSKDRLPGAEKNLNRLHVLFASANLYMFARAGGSLCPA